MYRIILLTVVAIGLLASPVFSAAPKMISYQGLLTDSTSSPIDTTVSITFTIYDASAAGNIKWTENHTSVIVSEGLFSVILGAGSPPVPIEDSVFNQPDRYLGITVGGDPEISPRTQMLSVGYSQRVNTVDGATGGVISGDVSIQSDLTVFGKATIGPGHTNTGTSAFVAGASNSVTGTNSTVGGGTANIVSGNYSTISGGTGNSATEHYATVGGGLDITASGRFSTVGGGTGNKASGQSATVSGGGDNTANGNIATVGGGSFNFASEFYATVGGGATNTASGTFATVPGGFLNNATGSSSFAAGTRANALHDGTFVWSNGDGGIPFNSTDSNQFLINAPGGVGISTNTPTEALSVNGRVESMLGGFKFPDGSIQETSASNGTVPVGSVVSWLKSFPNTPPLPDGFVECSGQTLSDVASVFDGQVIPDLNGSFGSQRFLRGSSSSGLTGGADNHSHGINRGGWAEVPGSGGEIRTGALATHTGDFSTQNTSMPLPSYYEVVWIMRIK